MAFTSSNQAGCGFKTMHAIAAEALAGSHPDIYLQPSLLCSARHSKAKGTTLTTSYLL